MANRKIFELTRRASSALAMTDEIEGQIGADGASFKSLLQDISERFDMYKGILDVRELGIVNDTGLNQATLLQTAYNEAESERRFLYIPNNFTVGVGSTVDVKVPTIGGIGALRNLSYEPSATIRNVGINNVNTPMLRMDIVTNPILMNFFTWQGIAIDGNSGGGLNCTGLNVVGGISGSIRVLTHALFRNASFVYCTGFGFRVVGFLNIFEALRTYQCGINRLVLANSSKVVGGEYVPIDGNATSWGLQLVASDGVSTSDIESAHVITLDTVCIEGGAVGNGLLITENNKQVHLRNLYLEGFGGNSTTETYALLVGSHRGDEDDTSASKVLQSPSYTQERAVQDLVVDGGSLSSGAYDADGLIIFDNVFGLHFPGGAPRHGRAVIFRARCTNVTGVTNSWVQNDAVYSPDGFNADESERLAAPARNVILNPHGFGGVRGWRNVTTNPRITASQVTSPLKAGNFALRLVHTPSGADQYDHLELYPFGLEERRSMSNRWVVLAGWIYVTNAGDYGTGNSYPGLSLVYEYENPVSTWNQVSAIHSMGYQNYPFFRASTWTYCRCWVNMPNYAIRNTHIRIYPSWVNGATRAPTTTNTMYIRGLTLCVDPSSLQDIGAGRVTLDQEAGSVISGQITVIGESIPSNASIAARVHDKVVRGAGILPGSNIGWVCTTAGSPGTWYPFGEVQL